MAFSIKDLPNLAEKLLFTLSSNESGCSDVFVLAEDDSKGTVFRVGLVKDPSENTGYRVHVTKEGDGALTTIDYSSDRTGDSVRILISTLNEVLTTEVFDEPANPHLPANVEIAHLPRLAEDMLSSLGHTCAANGDLLSGSFSFAREKESAAGINVSLCDRRRGLARNEWGYSIHVSNSIAGTDKIYQDNGHTGTPEDIVFSMLQEALVAELCGAPIPARLPTYEEWDALMDIVSESNKLAHWKDMYFWCQDESTVWALNRAVRGYRSARCWGEHTATNRNVYVGFRPAFDVLTTDHLVSDGTLITAGTLYMGGQPVRVPQNPICNGDIADYIPGTKLEFRAALEDPAYQIQAIKVGNILIADRSLLKNISWEDLAAQGFCIKD